ncbi:MAG: OmpA family protein [Thiolinea sp.]
MSEKRSCCCGALPKLWWWLLTLLGLPLLFWLMVSSRQNPVETDLATRATDGLKAASLNDVQVNLDHRGRDAQLTGKVASDAEREQAAKLVQDTQGIRVVDNAIEVVTPVAAAIATAPAVEAAPVVAAPAQEVAAPPPATPAVEPSLALLPQDGKCVLQGSLSSQAEIDQALAAAEGMYGAGNVVNQLTIGTVAPATWLGSLGGLKDALAGIEQSGLKFANGAFALTGVASSEQAKAAALEKVQQLLGNAKVEDQLTVKAPEIAVAPAPEATQAVPATAEPVQPAAATTPEPAAPVAMAEVAPPAPATEPAQPVPTAATEPAPVPAAPEPAPVLLTTEQQSCQDQFNTTMNGQQILFETNKAIIKRDSLKLLDGVAKIATDCKSALDGKMLRVGGHTDNVGEDVYNQNLSQQRADAVKEYLGKQGLDSGSIQGVGYGEAQPIASNDTEAGRAQNRRISFDIIQK